MLPTLDHEGPLHGQVYRAIRNDILTQTLVPGERVPPTRSLAASLRISRNTVVRAYEQLLAEGYLEARVGAAGTIVASTLPQESFGRSSAKAGWAARRTPSLAEPRLAVAGARIVRGARATSESLGISALTWELSPPRIAFDFRPGRAAFADVPYARWCRLLGSRARRASVRDLEYGPPQGRHELREAIANRLRRLRGIDADPDRVVIVNGTQQALDLICRVLLDPGDRVLIEEPHYTGARCAFVSAGGELVPANVDEQGLQVPTANRRAVRLAYVTPSHQFPTGVVMPVPRRLELLNWASHQNAFIVEDDYDSEYRYDGPPLQALAGLDREGRVIYVGTFSKILFPSLRLGYLVLPQSLVEPVVAAKAVGDTGNSALEQLTLADFISEGHFDRHLRRTNISNAARRNALVEAIGKEFGDRAEVCGANSGLHLLVWLKDKKGRMIENVFDRALAAGVGLFPVDCFYTKPPRRTGVVLGYAPLRERDIREGIRRLAAALTQNASHKSGDVR
jgi:GntR family transcriptional regulator/MocR family aminotransferase